MVVQTLWAEHIHIHIYIEILKDCYLLLLVLTLQIYRDTLLFYKSFSCCIVYYTLGPLCMVLAAPLLVWIITCCCSQSRSRQSPDLWIAGWNQSAPFFSLKPDSLNQQGSHDENKVKGKIHLGFNSLCMDQIAHSLAFFQLALMLKELTWISIKKHWFIIAELSAQHISTSGGNKTFEVIVNVTFVIFTFTELLLQKYPL